MNTEQVISTYEAKIKLRMSVGRFVIKTITTVEELQQAFLLRYQVFQVEMIGSQILLGEDKDEFDRLSDHLAIFDTKTNQMIATCRLNCSLFSQRFYSEQEFHCASLMERPETKLEIGRVCVHRDFRKGIVIMLLWRGLAEYMGKTETRFLFGCGSVATLDPLEAVVIYRYLEEEGKVRNTLNITPTEQFKSAEFEKNLLMLRGPLAANERALAESLLPSLCRSYFDIGCYVPGTPAFDYDFKCIDFLTVLDVNELDPQMRRKMLGSISS
jgi:putative hemolysin